MEHFLLLFLTVILIVVVVISSILNSVNIYLSVTFVVWCLSMGYYLYNYKTNIANICFMIAFFTFLMGREMCFYYFGMPKYYLYSDEINELTFFLLLISIIAVNMGSFIVTILNKKFIFFNKRISYFNELRYVSGIAYYFCYIFLIISSFIQIRYVQEVGYLGSYLGKGAGIPGCIAYLALFTPTALCLYLVSLPSKIQSILAMLFYEVYAVLMLFTGQRFPFIGITMLLMSYCVLRERYNGGWIRKKYIYGVVISIPLLLFFLNAYDSIRIGRTFEIDNLLEIFLRFCDLQGGSINVIKRTLFFYDSLTDVSFWSFSTLKGLLLENFISRNIFDITVYSGNSITTALMGHSLAHRLSWYSYGDMYLMGRGVGTSYIAELFIDFGIAGVVVGSILYGIILKKISLIDFKNPIFDGILLTMVYHLLFAPRGEFDGFTRWICNIIAIPGVILIVFIAQQLYKNKFDGVDCFMENEKIKFDMVDCFRYIISKRFLIIFFVVISTCLAGFYSYLNNIPKYVVGTSIVLPVNLNDKHLKNIIELVNQRNGELGFRNVALVNGTSILRLTFEENVLDGLADKSRMFTNQVLKDINVMIEEQSIYDGNVQKIKTIHNKLDVFIQDNNQKDSVIDVKLVREALNRVEIVQLAKIPNNATYDIKKVVPSNKRNISMGIVFGLVFSIFYVVCGYFYKLGNK